MSYPTILVHVDNSPHAEGRIRLAINLAAACRSHLVGGAMAGVARFVYPDPSLPVAVDLIGQQIDAMQERADQALQLFETLAQRAGIETYERRRLDDEPDTGLALQARYADLVVLSQTGAGESGPDLVSTLPGYVMLHSVRPVLVVPSAQPPDDIVRHALIAWNGSSEAARAISWAMPLLHKVRDVTLAVINPQASYGLHGDQPGADAATWIARHGVKVNVMVQETGGDVGDALLAMAADLGADLMVMGGYGRTRFRELLLGGVTRTVLANMRLPVLMAH
jgi:nucleotide-binding universal stress UspA family protein